MLNDPLANALNTILHAQKVGKNECVLFPISSVMLRVLDIMNTHHYIGKVDVENPKAQASAKVALIGSLNKCAVIKPRFSVKKDNYEKFEKRYLPARGIGILVVSTSQGIMTHEEAKKKGLGGTLIAYAY